MTTNTPLIVAVIVSLVSFAGRGVLPVCASNEQERPEATEAVKSEAGKELLNGLGVSDQEQTTKKLSMVVNELLRSRDSRLIPLLEERLAEADTLADELQLLGKLVYLGSKDERHWQRISNLAAEAAQRDMPTPVQLGNRDDDGRPRRSPAFLAWLEESGLTDKEAGRTISRDLSALNALGAARDRRGLSTLLDCLASPNLVLVPACLRGLAHLQDVRAIGPMIDAIRRFSEAERTLLARNLLFFDDPEAQAAAEEFIGNPKTLARERRRIAEHGLVLLYGY